MIETSSSFIWLFRGSNGLRGAPTGHPINSRAAFIGIGFVVANKAFSELNGLQFDKALDAVKAIDVGIKGQREVLSGMINLQFVQDVLGIIIEEVADQDTLNKIAVKLKTLVQQQEDM